MERNETPVSKAIKAKLRLVDEEVEAAWLGDRGHIYAELDPAPYFTATLAVDTTHIHHRAQIESFPYITAMLIMNKAKSMIATALEVLPKVDADENLQKAVKKFILKFFNYSDYTQRLPVFVGEVERKLSSWRKDYNPEELGLTKIEDLFQSYVKYALQKAREVIDVEFTLLRTQTTPKHLEVREETDRPISKGNIFRKEGDFWEVSFDGKAVSTIKHLIGMDYIKYLVENPYRSTPATEFIRTSQISREADPLNKMSKDQLEELSLTKSRSPGHLVEKLDHKEKAKNEQRKDTFRKRIKELNEIIDEKESPKDERSRAIEEKNMILNELSDSFTKSNDKARSSVKNAINRAITHIKQHHPGLADHLKKYVALGHTCLYIPPVDLHWNSDL